MMFLNTGRSVQEMVVGWDGARRHFRACFLPLYVSKGIFPEGCEEGGKFLNVFYYD